MLFMITLFLANLPFSSLSCTTVMYPSLSSLFRLFLIRFLPSGNIAAIPSTVKSQFGFNDISVVRSPLSVRFSLTSLNTSLLTGVKFSCGLVFSITASPSFHLIFLCCVSPGVKSSFPARIAPHGAGVHASARPVMSGVVADAYRPSCPVFSCHGAWDHIPLLFSC